MGTRLYPLTRDAAALETLAGVPAGTMARLDAIKAPFAARSQARQEAFEAAPEGAAGDAVRSGLRYEERVDSEAEWNAVNADQDAGTLDGFLTFGWGKFNGVGLALDYAGHLDDLTACRRVLEANGIAADPALTGGLCWG